MSTGHCTLFVRARLPYDVCPDTSFPHATIRHHYRQSDVLHAKLHYVRVKGADENIFLLPLNSVQDVRTLRNQL